MRKSEISNFFIGSGSFVNHDGEPFGALIVDEAHRLNEKSGMFRNMGENQVKEIIKASNCVIFFIDENQQVTWNDIGRKDEIIRWANELGAEIIGPIELTSQFRYRSGDGFLAWLDNVLEINETANYTLDDVGYDFRIVDSPNQLRELINEKNKNKQSPHCYRILLGMGKRQEHGS